MLKTSKSIEFTTRPGKGGVGFGADGSDDGGDDGITTSMVRMSLSIESSAGAVQIGVGYNKIDDGSGCSNDFDKNSSDVPKSMCPPTPLISRLRTSASTDSSTSVAQVMVKYNEVDGGKSGADSKSIKKLSKIQKIVKKSKSFKDLKNLQQPLVWRNVYQSTNLPSIRYKELELLLEL